MSTHTEESARTQEALLAPGRIRSILDDLPALVAVMTADGELQFVNRQVSEYFGATFDELRRWENGSAIHSDDRANLIAAWSQSLQTGQPYDVEARQRRADGIYRWFHIRGFPVREEGGIVLWHVLQTDVEDRKRAESLLAGEKRLLEMVATGQPLAETLARLCLLVEELSANCVCCSILLLDHEGQKLWHAASPNVPVAYTQTIDGFAIGPEVSSCGTAAWYAKQVIASDIATDSRWVAFRDLALESDLRACWSTPILSQQGRVLGTFAMFSSTARSPTADDQQLIAQVTHLASIAIERSRAEEALKRSEEFLAQAQQVSLTGGFYWWPASGKLAWSEQVYRIFELDPGVPVRLELLWTRIHPEDQPAFQEMLERQLRQADDFEHHHRLLMPDASVKYLHVVAKATQDLEGRLLYIAAVQDVTGRRLADDALGKVRSELAHVARVTSLGALTASIAHEVNQPLSGIITNANTCVRMLAADPPNIDGARETARRTIRDGNRASDVIKRLRALFAKEDIAAELVDLNEATREVIVLSSSELQRHRMIVQLELAEHLPSVTGDRVQLQQVILNLILNASEAMSGVHDRPRRLVIGTKREDGGRVLLSVQDAGVGFEPEGVEKMFHAFYTTKSNGMGMGLSISRSIIESHHGRLWAHENDGPGATFSFVIPARSQSATAEGVTINRLAVR